MIDLKDYYLSSRKDDDAVMVQHVLCRDCQAVSTLDDALQWAGDHVCGH